MRFDDPAFWRAGAISTILVMSAVLIMLTIDSLAAISPGGSHVPPYTAINQHIEYKFVAERGIEVPVIAAPSRCSARLWMPMPRQRLSARARWSFRAALVLIATPFSATAPITLRISRKLGSVRLGSWQAITTHT